MKNKKILFVTSSYPFHNNDTSGIFIYKISQYISKQCSEITILAPTYKGIREKDIKGIKVIPLRYFFKKLELLNPPGGGAANAVKKNPLLLFLVPLYFLSLMFALIKINKHYDGIVFFWFWNAFPVMLLNKIRNKSIIAIYGSDFQFFLKNIFIKKIFIRSLQQFKAIITDNPYTQSLVPMSKLVYMGVDTNDIKKTALSLDKYIIFCGNLTDEKGIKDLLQIYKRNNIKADLLIAGDGPHRNYVENFIFETNLQKKIIYLGRVIQNELFFYIRNAILLVLPTTHPEGTPNVILEAITLGTPFIAYEMPQLKLFKENSDLFLVESKNLNQLEKRISKVIEDKNIKAQMKEIEKKWLHENKISWENTVRKYLEYLFK